MYLYKNLCMIARHWKGIAHRHRAAEYIAHLRNDTFAKLNTLNGFRGASILQRETETGVEFLIITEWESIEAVKQFAGEQYETAVVPPLVQEIMISYDTVVPHYEVVAGP